MPNAMLGMALPRVRECWAEATNVTAHTIVKWDEVPRHPSKRVGAKWCKVGPTPTVSCGLSLPVTRGRPWC